MKRMLYVLFIIVSIVTRSVHPDQDGPGLNMSIVTEDCDRRRFNCRTEVICRCDVLCILYGDCCYDVQVGEQVASEDELLYASHSDCRHIAFDEDSIEKNEAVFMVSRCPNSYPDNVLRSGCESNSDNYSNILNVAPVSMRNPNFVFKNKFCALCHGVNDFTMFGVNLKLDIGAIFKHHLPLTENIARATLDEKSVYRYIPNTSVRQCYDIVLGQGIAKNIKSCKEGYLGPLIGNDIKLGYEFIARNRECANEIMDTMATTDKMIYCYMKSTSKRITSFGGTVNLSLLQEKMLKKTLCEETEIYLSPKDGCHDLHCPYNFAPFFGECLNKTEVFNDTTGLVQVVFFQANDTVEVYDGFFLPNFKDVVRSQNSKFASHIWISFHGHDDDTNTTCSLLKLVIFEKTFVHLNTFIRKQLNLNIRNRCKGFSAVKENVSFRYRDTIEESTCKTETALDVPKYILSSFDDVYQSSYVPCPAVRVSQFQEGSGNVDEHLVFRLSLSGKDIQEEDLVRIGNKYFLCIRNYYQTHARTSVGSRYLPSVTCVVGILVTWLSFT